MARPKRLTQPSPEPSSLAPDKAISVLQRQIVEGNDLLSNQPMGEARYNAWETTTREFLVKAFGSDSGNINAFFNIGHYGSFPMNASEQWREQHRADSLGKKIAMLEGSIKQLQVQLEVTSEVEDASTSTPLDALSVVLDRFHLVARQLRRRHSNRTTISISDEYDVQDLLHSLLRLYFDDIRPEEYTPSYAGGTARMDFLLHGEEVVVEVKMTRDGLGEREVGNQLLEDIGRYHAHPRCRTLVCFVYDPGEYIYNPRGIERDLSREHDGMDAYVLIRPMGH